MIITAFSEVTIDGKLSLGLGHSSKTLFDFFGPELARWFHARRAAHDAIMVGAGTVRVDNPELTVRNVVGPNPWRVVPLGLTPLPADSTILTDGLLTLFAVPSRHGQAYRSVETMSCGTNRADLPDLIRSLSVRGIRADRLQSASD